MESIAKAISFSMVASILRSNGDNSPFAAGRFRPQHKSDLSSGSNNTGWYLHTAAVLVEILFQPLRLFLTPIVQLPAHSQLDISVPLLHLNVHDNDRLLQGFIPYTVNDDGTVQQLIQLPDCILTQLCHILCQLQLLEGVSSSSSMRCACMAFTLSCMRIVRVRVLMIKETINRTAKVIAYAGSYACSW